VPDDVACQNSQHPFQQPLILIIDESQPMKSDHLDWYQLPLPMMIQFVSFNAGRLKKCAQIEYPEKAVSSCTPLNESVDHN
jgi:hypothetical protein